MAQLGWQGLLSISELLFSYKERHGEIQAREVMDFMVKDENNPSSILSCLGAARENARAVRGALTTEVWETQNTTWLEVKRMVKSGEFERDPAQFFECALHVGRRLQRGGAPPGGGPPAPAGGRLLVHHANPLALAREPQATAAARCRTAALSRRSRASTRPPAWTGALDDWCAAMAALLEGTAQLRYYSPSEWEPLASRAGLHLTAVTSTTPPPGGRLGPEAPDLIALLEKP